MMKIRQAGFSMVAIVMILLMIGLLIMTSLNRQLSAQLWIDNEERYYLKSYNQAISALSWGLQQVWPRPQNNWHCKENQALQFLACVKTFSNSENVLLKGSEIIRSSENIGSNKGNITLYYLASLTPVAIEDASTEERFNLVKLPSGWLDFCPVNEC